MYVFFLQDHQALGSGEVYDDRLIGGRHDPGQVSAAGGTARCCSTTPDLSSLTSLPWFQVYIFQSRRQLSVQWGHGLSEGLWLGARPLLRLGAGGVGESLRPGGVQPAAGV